MLNLVVISAFQLYDKLAAASISLSNTNTANSTAITSNTVISGKRTASHHKKFIEYQQRRTLSHESDHHKSSSSSEDSKAMAEVLVT